MAPLIATPCLVLDDFDRMDVDIRVVRSLVEVLDTRYAARRPTILTSARWLDALVEGTGPEAGPLKRLDDRSVLHRLAQARRVMLRPTLERLLQGVGI